MDPTTSPQGIKKLHYFVGFLLEDFGFSPFGLALPFAISAIIWPRSSGAASETSLNSRFFNLLFILASTFLIENFILCSAKYIPGCKA